MNDWTNTFVYIVVSIIVLATIAVIVNKGSNAPAVIQSATSVLGSFIKEAVSPIQSTSA